MDVKIAEAEVRVLDTNKTLGKINGEVEHLSFWANVYSKELKLKLFEDACPFLDARTRFHLDHLKNRQINVQFSTIKRLATGGAKEEFNVDVWSETGGFGFDSLSGGEQQMVSFAIGLSLSDLSSRTAMAQASFLILDEPFSELDARNSEAIVEYLTGEMGKDKDTVFLISNEESLKGLIPNTVHVVKERGVTHVE
jgi:DNA repair exonuclease SbcCD ATPase subunit